jgi:hypothetical protein
MPIATVMVVCVSGHTTPEPLANRVLLESKGRPRPASKTAAVTD